MKQSPGKPAGPIERFEALDGLRGIAAFVVAYGHVMPGHRNAALAVDFFFVLSGFVLTHSYARKLESGLSFAAYMRSRIIRLFPLIVLGTLIGIFSFPGIPWGALLIPVPGDFMYPMNRPAWSLLFELIASALFGLGLWRGWRVFPVTLIAALGLVLAAYNAETLDAGVTLTQFHYAFTRVVFGFGLGALLYRYRLGVRLPPLVLCGVLALILFQPWTSWYYQLAMVLVVCPFLIAAGANSRSFPGAKLAGDLSYPLYIVHWPVFMLASALPAPVQIALALAVAWLALKLYDIPVRKWLSGKRAKPSLRTLRGIS